jgi:hypothetical protein
MIKIRKNMTSSETELSHELIGQLIAEIQGVKADRSRHEELIMGLAVQSGEIITRVAQQTSQVIQSNEQLIAQLKQLPEHTLKVVHTAVDQRMAQLGVEASRQVAQGVSVPLQDFAQNVKAMHEPVLNETRQLGQTFHKLRESAQGLFNKIHWSVGGSLAVLVFGSIGLLYFYQSSIRQTKMQADWVQALNRSDLSLCGDAICTKVLDAKGKPQYVRVGLK